MHVPLILRLPGAGLGGTRVSARVRLIDVMPTLLAFAGLPSPPHAQGESLILLYARRGSEAGSPRLERMVQGRAAGAAERSVEVRSSGWAATSSTISPQTPAKSGISPPPRGGCIYPATTRHDRLQSLSRELLRPAVNRGDKPRARPSPRATSCKRWGISGHWPWAPSASAAVVLNAVDVCDLFLSARP